MHQFQHSQSKIRVRDRALACSCNVPGPASFTPSHTTEALETPRHCARGIVACALPRHRGEFVSHRCRRTPRQSVYLVRQAGLSSARSKKSVRCPKIRSKDHMRGIVSGNFQLYNPGFSMDLLSLGINIRGATIFPCDTLSIFEFMH